MNAATSSELAKMGLPFFALDPALICAGDHEQGKKGGEKGVERGGKEEGRGEGEGESSGKISRKEVEELKIRMLTLLQDLCEE